MAHASPFENQLDSLIDKSVAKIRVATMSVGVDELKKLIKVIEEQNEEALNADELVAKEGLVLALQSIHTKNINAKTCDKSEKDIRYKFSPKGGDQETHFEKQALLILKTLCSKKSKN